MVRPIRLAIVALLLCAASPMLAANVAAPATAQSEIATLNAQVAALKDQRDLEKRLATLEGQQKAVDSERDRMNNMIQLFGLLFAGLGAVSFVFAGQRAAIAAREEITKQKDKIAEMVADAEASTTAAKASAEGAAVEHARAKDSADALEADAEARLDKRTIRAGERENVELTLKDAGVIAQAVAANELPERQWTVRQFRNAIGKAMYVDENWAEALRLAVDMESVHGADEDALRYALNGRGDAARELARHGEALAAYQAVIAITKDDPRPSQQQDYIWAAHHLGVCLIELHRAAEAEAMLRALLPIKERIDGAEAPGTLVTRAELARAVLVQGRADEAEKMLRALLPIRERINGAEASGTLMTRQELAQAIIGQGRAPEAEAMLRDLLPIRERVDGPEASNTLVTRHDLARAILDQGRAAEAEPMLRDLVRISEIVEGFDHSYTIVGRCKLVDALVQSGDVEAARTALAAIPDPVTNSDWLPRWDAALAFVRGRVADAMGDTQAAEAHLARAAEIFASIYPEDHYDRQKLKAYRDNRPAKKDAPDA